MARSFSARMGQSLGKFVREQHERAGGGLFGDDSGSLLSKANATASIAKTWDTFAAKAGDETVKSVVVANAIEEYLKGTPEGKPVKKRAARA